MHPEVVPVIPVLEGGTDAGSMLIFDPSTLPDDYDVRVRHDPIAVIERLFDHGCLYWLDTASDGGYSLGICVSECLPGELARFARPLGVAARFTVASGRLYFTGIEYAFRHDDSFLRRYPHMGACYAIPAGTYRLTLYEMDYLEDFHEDLLRQKLSANDFRLYTLMNNGLIPLGCISAISLVVSPLLLGLRLWSITALPLCVPLALSAILISRSRSYREASHSHLAIQREYPDFCAALEVGTRE
jgi:hypothetical protein